jgi:hydrogenase maturation protease
MSDDVIFRARALAQAHPLSRLASRYVNDIVARECEAQPHDELGVWAGYALTNGYCLRRIEEVDVLGDHAPNVAAHAREEDLDRLETLATALAKMIRTTGAEDHYLFVEDRVIEALDRMIEGEIDRRLEPWKGTVPAETWRELENYLAWWVVKGYALRIAEAEVATKLPNEPAGDDKTLSRSPRVLVACVGNQLLSDDAVGLGVAKILWERPPTDGVLVEEYGIGGIHLVQRMMERDLDGLVVVDCADRSRPPGTVMIVEPEIVDIGDMPEVERFDYLTDMHYTNPERALSLAKALGLLPDDVVLIGIQPADAEQLGEALSPEVEAAVEIAADEALRIAGQMLKAVE